MDEIKQVFQSLLYSIHFTTKRVADAVFSKKIKSIEDLSEVRVPCLGQIPVETELPSFPLDRPIPRELKHAFHKITSELIKYVPTNSSVIVTSPDKSCGKTFVATHLAMTLASIGKSVLLVDLDLRIPALKKYLNLPNKTSGIGTGIKSFYDWDKDVFNYGPNLDVLCCPEKIESAPELLERKILKLFIEYKSKTYDYVLLDSPPANGFIDVSIISSYVNAGLIVANFGSHSSEEIRFCRNSLLLANSLQTFGVINRSPNA